MGYFNENIEDYETIEHESGQLRARVVYDPDPAFPLEGDVETTSLSGSRYIWDAENDMVLSAYDRFTYFARHGKYAQPRDYDRVERMMQRYFRIFCNQSIIIRDSVGMSKGDWARIAYLVDNDTEVEPELALEAAALELEAYRAGEVYGIIVERRLSEDIDDDDAWEEVNSCWGYVGSDYAVAIAQEELNYYAARTPLQTELEVGL